MKAIPGVPIAVAFCVAVAGGALVGGADLRIAAPARAEEPAAPSVAVTVKPLHALVAGVMQGIGKPVLLYRAGPAAGPLDPEAQGALARTRVLFWLDKAQAPHVAAAIAGRVADVTTVGLLRARGVRLMDARPGHRRVAAGTPRPRAAAPQARKPVPQVSDGNVIFRKRGTPAPRTAAPARKARPAKTWRSKATPPARIADPDPRVWLDPRNAIAVVRAVAEALAKVDPAHGARYRRNAAVMVVRIETLNDGLTAAMRTARKTRYAVANNRIQYFEDNYVMMPAQEFRIVPPAPKAAVAAARRQVAAAGPVCVLAPSLAPHAAQALVAGTKARVAALDLYGRDLTPGPDAYVELMKGIGGKIAACLR